MPSYYKDLKAFDKVPHIRLCHKLASYGIRGNILSSGYMQSFLSERSQRVVLNGKQSDSCTVLFGVPHAGLILRSVHQM